MRRREFITLIGGAATWPLAARAQPRAKPTVGLLVPGRRSMWGEWAAAFVQRLRELGWIEGRSVAIDYRWAEERFDEIAAEFVRLNVDVIVTAGTPAILAAKKATSLIPIVFAAAADPVGAGLVASLAGPVGNITGLSLLMPDLAGKRIELLREVIPALRALAIMGNVGNRGTVLEIAEVQAAAETLGLEVAKFEIRRAEDIAPAFETLKGRAGALYIVSDPLVVSDRGRINTLALGVQMPTLYSVEENVRAGGLLSYGPNRSEMWRRAADFVDKILRGAKPAEIPIEQPTKLKLVINLKTARALGLTIPDKVLALADEVIE
jgi:putative ABC transport system substrate-binding protein